METKTGSLLNLLHNARMYDLAQPYFIGMPHHPSHPPFLFSLNKMHGDYVMPNGGSYTSESLALGGTWGRTSTRCAIFPAAASCMADTMLHPPNLTVKASRINQ
jgi:hypothetical protein